MMESASGSLERLLRGDLPTEAEPHRFCGRIDLVLDAVPAMVAIIGTDRRYRFVNRPYQELVGLPEAEIIGRTPAEILGETVFRPLRGFGERALAGETVLDESWTHFPGLGLRYVKRVYTPLRLDDGRIDGFVVCSIDHTERQRAAEMLQASEAVKSALIAGALDCLIGIDGTGTIVEFNPAAERTFGWPRSAVIGRPVTEILVVPEGSGVDAPNLAQIFAGQDRSALAQRLVVEGHRADATRFAAELTVTQIMVGGRLLFTAYLRDISDRLNFERDLAALAYQDPVTGLPNRLQFLREINNRQDTGQAFTLVVIEVDRFGDLHSSFGREFADDLLRGLADRLQATLTAGEVLARVGERAFGLLLGGAGDRAAVQTRIEALSALVRTAVSRSGAAVFLTASIGVATVDAGRIDAEDILRNGEIATGRARDAGGARSVWFDQSMHDQVLDRIRMEHDLRRALERDAELWLAFQPIIEMVTGRLAGFEALVRWNHPTRGFIPPGSFIPIAEDTGLIVALGRWVLRHACRQIAAWQPMREPGSAPLFMSVNLSPREIEESDCCDSLLAVLTETGVDPAWIKMELTEGAVMQKPEESLAMLRRLKGFGVRLSIDDFGTGYSSLSYLTRFPIDSIKIDRSFVNALQQSDEARSIVRIIIDLARLLGFDVIAEGIETAADANLLRALACDYGQGYFYSRPVAPDKADPFVRGDLPWREDFHRPTRRA